MNLSIALPTSAGALVAVVVLLVLRGDLLTRRVVDRILYVLNPQLAEKDEQIQLWREAHDTVKKANDALISQLYQSLEIGRTANKVLDVLPAPPSGGRNGPGAAA
jgi:hypothetical protein